MWPRITLRFIRPTFTLVKPAEMNQRIFRSCSEPIRERERLSWDQIWKGPDKGLIVCWEIGRELGIKEPELAAQARNGELPPCGWKGGIEKEMKTKEKYGSLFYLAQWQGLRGEDLNIDLFEETELICSRTGMKVIYTNNPKKYGAE